MDLKTPGVYIEEISLFPPSVVPVATAIPAFVGYTQLTENKENSLINKAIRVSSLLEYNTMFGAGYQPAAYRVEVAGTAPDLSITNISPRDASNLVKKYYLYDAVKQYFDNGGGPCYVVSVGDYTSAVEFGADDVSGIRGGLKALEKVDEPTILLVPDSVLLPDETQTGEVHKKIADQCAKLKDRFGILDIFDGHLPENSITDKPLAEFRSKVGAGNLKYTAAYYPWLYSAYFKEVHFTQIKVVDSADVAVVVDDVDGLIGDMKKRADEESKAFSQITAVAINRNNFNPISTHFEGLRNDINSSATTGSNIKAKFTKLVKLVREMSLAFITLEKDVNISSELKMFLTSLKAETSLQDEIKNLVGFEANDDVVPLLNTVGDYTPFDGTDWVGGLASTGTLKDMTDYTGATNLLTGRAAANSTVLFEAFTEISNAYARLIESAIFFTDQAEKKLFGSHPFYKTAYERIRKDMSLLPPSGAMAGVYAATDRNRGVWKAPANVSLRAVVGPAVKLNDHDQENLNVHTTGKSINVIRDFIGKGTLVWGARTLDGNSNEWRYISVRRFFNMVEESTKKATEPFVFESNDANTWVKVRAMIENFLTLQWRAGALAGAKPEHAFYVKVGLGQTMTALDILEGRMIVEIGMAVVRPAEFIVLRFSHKMQES